jgi:hypothetical protein
MIRIVSERSVAPELVQQPNVIEVEGEQRVDLDKREISQLKRGREEMVQTQQSSRIISRPKKSLREGAESCAVATLDCSKNCSKGCKLEVLVCKIYRSSWWEELASSTFPLGRAPFSN